MVKLRTIKGAVKEIKTADPGTAMTESFLKQLVDFGEVKSDVCGDRIVFDMNVLSRDLALLFEQKIDKVPKMRTVRDAVCDIRASDTSTDITEYKIRLWIKHGRLHCYTVGTRQIVVMEDFENGIYLDTGSVTIKGKNHTEATELSRQFDRVLSNTTQSYQCCRKHSASLD